MQRSDAPPVTILFHHLEKTGGSSVVKWFEALARSKQLTHAVGFGHATCFAHLFPELLPSVRPPGPRRTRKCAAALPTECWRARV